MYKKDETTEKVLSVIKNYFDENGIDAKNLNEKSNLMKDYDLDSLDYLELFDNLEEEFDIQVSDNMKDYNRDCKIVCVRMNDSLNLFL